MSKQSNSKGNITSHVLDLSRGKPVSNLQANLYKREDNDSDKWLLIGKDVSNEDGRMTQLSRNEAIETGIYKISFQSGIYFEQLKLETFYPEISIIFNITDPNQHYHVPLLLNQFGFSTYRGS